MNKRYYLLTFLLCLVLSFSVSKVLAQESYSNYKALTERMQNLASQHDELTNLQSLGQSADGNDIWLLTIGEGNTSQKPAIAVIGGAKGSHILGSELSLQFAEKLLARADEDSIQTLLQDATFYVMPRINPDAAEQYFANLKYERDGNTTATDDDRDGTINEDPYEDLNSDGFISMMRIKSDPGGWMIHEDDARVMVKADPAKGERGNYRMLTEGRDNDSDELFNEDGPGGVNINKNFTFDYPYFEAGAGENMASQPETRAVLDFLYETGWNVFAVVSFGPENNLSKPLSFNSRGVSERVITGWYEDDITINNIVSDLYNKNISLTDAPTGPAQQGDLFQWAYFHYGRFSFSTPGWWIPPIMDENGKPKKFSSEDAHYLAWADSQNVDGFIEWQQIDHPDFPDQIVEVGGIKPFQKLLPPYTVLDSLAAQHTNFLIKLGQMHPHIELTNVKTERVGDNITRVTVDMYNSGFLPTASRLGERTRWVRDANVKLNLPDNISIVSGQVYQSFDSINANESKTISWLLRGSGSFSIKAGAPTAGFSTIEQTIR